MLDKFIYQYIIHLGKSFKTNSMLLIYFGLFCVAVTSWLTYRRINKQNRLHHYQSIPAHERAGEPEFVEL